MSPDILIVGQGLAGSVLGWELERAGISFRIADAGLPSATRAAAGIVNPITGRRLTKTAGIETQLPAARALYRDVEAALGVPLWRDLRVRRIFADEREREMFASRQARGELTPFLGASDATGFWIEGAGRVDLPGLLDGLRERWQRQRKLRNERVDWARAAAEHELIVDCTGRADTAFDFVPWEFSKGEVLRLSIERLDPDVILNDGRWLLPLGDREAMVGATHEPGKTDLLPSADARRELEASARRLLGGSKSHETSLAFPLFQVTSQLAGVRTSAPDRRPVAGRHPKNPRLGLLNGLGGRGAHWAPWLARQWVNHLTEGVPFSSDVDVARFWHYRSSQA